jgi:hypothetical protein
VQSGIVVPYININTWSFVDLHHDCHGCNSCVGAPGHARHFSGIPTLSFASDTIHTDKWLLG